MGIPSYRGDYFEEARQAFERTNYSSSVVFDGKNEQQLRKNDVHSRSNKTH